MSALTASGSLNPSVHCSRDHSENHETWTLELNSRPTLEQQALVHDKMIEYAALECERDVEIAWVAEIGELRLFGWPTADADVEAHRRRQATWRAERLLEHLHGAHGRLMDDSSQVVVALTHFEWHRPFYHAWRIAWSAPASYPFELFACFLAAPLTAFIAMAAVHAIGSDPHFAGIADAIAQLPMVLMFFCGIRQRAKRRHSLTLSKTGLVALVESDERMREAARSANRDSLGDHHLDAVSPEQPGPKSRLSNRLAARFRTAILPTTPPAQPTARQTAVVRRDEQEEF